MRVSVTLSFKETPKQIIANELLGGTALHNLLYGGSRSGKTFVLIRALLFRALREPNSRHAALRYRFNHAKQSLVYDTIPKVMEVCYPQLGLAEQYLNKSDWFYTLPNKSELWIGGVDDKERTEKILGNEYSTVYFNECSQIPYSSIVKVRTRLAQKNALKKKFYYDENPPSRGHWSYKEFIEHTTPATREPLPHDDYVSLLMNPGDNLENIDENYMRILNTLPEAERKRFRDGLWGEAVGGAVYGSQMQKLYEQGRITGVPYDPQFPVDTWWDIGSSDYTSIWFTQSVGREIWLIDYIQDCGSGKGPDFYWKALKDKGYNYNSHNLPHDAGNAQFALAGKSISNQFTTIGMVNKVWPKTLSVNTDIAQSRLFLPKCVFDKTKCADGLEAMEAYHYEYDEKTGMYKDDPYHDWSSHGADAFRNLAVHHVIKKAVNLDKLYA